jgi:hypothetical protein
MKIFKCVESHYQPRVIRYVIQATENGASSQDITGSFLTRDDCETEVRRLNALENA